MTDTLAATPMDTAHHDAWRQTHLGRLMGHALRRFDARVLQLMARNVEVPLALSNLAARDQVSAAHIHITRHLSLAGDRLTDLADTAASGKRWLLLGGLTTLVLTGSLYWRTGRPDLALAPPQTARSAIGDDMVQKLAARLAANPGDRAGWAMLGHSYYVLENYDGAVDAFARIAGTLSDDPDLLAEYAIALSLSSVEPRPHAARPLLEDASRLLPDNSALRVFLARDMLANGETGAAIAELEAARELEKADPLRVKFIESMIEEARHPR